MQGLADRGESSFVRVGSAHPACIQFVGKTTLQQLTGDPRMTYDRIIGEVTRAPTPAHRQQALDYAEALDIPFVFSSNGDAFLFHDNTGLADPVEIHIGLDAFPTPDELWHRHRAWKGLDDAQSNRFLPMHQLSSTS